MKAFVIFGALAGFLIGSGFGLASQSPWPTALWRACAVALASAWLARWWSRCWMAGLRESLERRQTAEEPAGAGRKPAAPTS